MKKLVMQILTILALATMAACSTMGFSTVTLPETIPAGLQTNAAASAVIEQTSSTAEATMIATNIYEEADDYVWDETSVVSISLNGNSISATGEGVTVDGSRAVISAAGTYRLSGTLDNGQITIDIDNKETVRLILNDVTIQNQSGSPVYVKKAEKTIIILAEGSQNILTDGAAYTFASTEVDEPNAAIFSKSDLTITGSGALTVNGNFKDGIASKDGLIINNGVITVNAADDGILGKDYLVIKAATLSVVSTGDGLKSDNDEDASKGFIAIQSGDIQVMSGGDAVTAKTGVSISGGNLTLTSGGGSTQTIDETLSAKAIKAGGNITIDDGTFTIDSAEDALHAVGTLTINAGTFSITAADDGLHSDSGIVINNGTINIPRSYEGIESAVITINGGEIDIMASDDAINVSTGSGEEASMPMGMGAGQDTFTYSGSNYLYINGGTIRVDAAGDGLDANGAIEMTGGVVIVNGTTEMMNGSLDYDSGFKMTGGFLVTAGSAGMPQAPGTYSAQNSVLINFDAAQSAGTLVHIQNASGEDILTFEPAKSYQSVLFSSAELVTGETYGIYLGGSSTGANTDGLFENGTYSSGTLFQEFTISNVVTTVGTTAGFMGGPGSGGAGGRGGGPGVVPGTASEGKQPLSQ